MDAKKTKAGKKKLRRFSVMLLYPESVVCEGPETFYAFVRASDNYDAVWRARKRMAGQFAESDDDDAVAACMEADAVLLLRGWRRGVAIP